VADGAVVGAVGDAIGCPTPPEPLFAERPAGQVAGDHGVELQTARVVSAAAGVRLPTEQRPQIDEHRRRRVDTAKQCAYRLPAITDPLKLDHNCRLYGLGGTYVRICWTGVPVGHPPHCCDDWR
jgi:hypothetical protein